MYTITYNGQILHDTRIEGRIVRSPVFHLAVNEADSASFTIDSDHPMLAHLQRMAGRLELLQDGVTVFRGRILRDTQDLYNSREIEAEGALAFLNDSVVPPYDYPNKVTGAAAAENTVAFFLEWVLGIHNAQVTPDRQILPGNVTVTDPNNYIARSNQNHTTSLETLRSKLVDLLGGYFLLRYTPDATYLDYVSELPLTNAQPVRFGENLLDILQDHDGSEIYTAILPVGAEGLTIEDELDGEITPDLVKEGRIIYSRAGRAQYGNITRIIDWPDVTLSGNLKTKAARQLALGLGTLDTITCTALDLGFSAADVAAFRVGRNVQVISGPHNLEAAFPLLELDLDILDPAATRITLGGTSVSFTGAMAGNQHAWEDVFSSLSGELSDVNTALGGVVEETRQQITQAVQDAQQILFLALEEYTRTSDFETYQQTVSSQFQQLAESITLQIQTVTREVTRVETDTQERILNITKYFRFDANGLWIGETGNEVLLRLDNDTIQFLRNNFAELWLDPRGIHADSVEVRRMQVGNFEFVGEADGRLTLRKVES